MPTTPRPIEPLPTTCLVRLSPAQARNLWPALRPYIAKALAEGHGEFRPIDILNNAVSGRCQIWAFANTEIHGAGVTEILQFPRRRVCQVHLWASDGRRDEWKPFLETVETWARESGCDGMEVLGRHGWKRVLGDYEMSRIVLRKGL